jgi:hypothetical protein
MSASAKVTSSPEYSPSDTMATVSMTPSPTGGSKPSATSSVTPGRVVFPGCSVLECGVHGECKSHSRSTFWEGGATPLRLRLKKKFLKFLRNYENKGIPTG